MSWLDLLKLAAVVVIQKVIKPKPGKPVKPVE